MAFIKQAPFPIHRTLHETFGARHPSSVFFGNRFRSADYQKIQLPPGGSQGRIVRIRPRFYKTITAYCNPSAAAAAAPLSGALFSLPPLGEVPRSGKGGVVGDFELLPFIEQHPLSQPCRFRSAVKSASSPNGGAKVGLARIRPRFYKTMGACREAAKGVTPVTLGCYQSTNNTPSVSLCSTAPPLGSQGPEPFRGAKGKSSQIRLYFLSRL